MRKHLRLIAPFVAVLGLLLGNRGIALSIPGNQASAATPGGTEITNAISATYSDVSGQTYATESNRVDTVVALLGSIVVSPKEPAASASEKAQRGTTVARTFVITNTSNISDAYTIEAAGAAPGSVVSVAFVEGATLAPVTLGATVSPTVAPGGNLSVVVTVAVPANAADGVDIPVTVTARTTATGTANGLQSDSGQQWIVTAPPASITGPGGSKIAKTVNDSASVQGQPGGTVTFEIVAVNGGGSPATNVVLTDPVPTGLTPVLSTVKVDGLTTGFTASLSGQTVSVKISTLDPGATMDVTFDCTILSAETTGLTFVNTASVTADGIGTLPTTPASVLTGSGNIVYNGYAGGNAPIGGATVALLDAAGNPVVLSGSNGSATRRAAATGASNTQNPFVTGPDGHYDFDIEPADIGPTGVRYQVTVAAPGFVNRRIQLDIAPSVAGAPLYDVRAVALDDQPIAVAGGFALTTNGVQLHDIFGFFGNLPMFTAGQLTLTKTVDRQVAQPGDRLDFTIDIRNATVATVAGANIVDTLPAGMAYAPGTAKLDGVAFEPVVSGRTLTWTIPSVGPASDHSLTYVCVVYPSVASGTTLTNSVSAAGVVSGTTIPVTGSSNVSVQILGGAFSDREVITGRVFVDTMHTGRFRRGDVGVAGVRVFMEDGSSVVTDGQGRFDFPGVRPGMHVLRIDPTSLPIGARAYDGYPMTSSRSPQQLVHGIMDDGLMEDVEFALDPLK